MTIAVTENELLSTMVEGYSYSRKAVADLLYDRPRSVVVEILDALVRKGRVWSGKVGERREYVRLSSAYLETVTKRAADRSDSPAWMKGTLTGYEASLRRAAIPEPTSYRA